MTTTTINTNTIRDDYHEKIEMIGSMTAAKILLIAHLLPLQIIVMQKRLLPVPKPLLYRSQIVHRNGNFIRHILHEHVRTGFEVDLGDVL
jgi:hypothetical protein